MNEECSARVVLGGRTTGYLGSIPGVIEEALIAARSATPLLVLGGFGGAAAEVASALGLVSLEHEGSEPLPYSGALEELRHLAGEWRATWATESEPGLRALADTRDLQECAAITLHC